MEEHPDLSGRIKAGADIVLQPFFESEILELQENRDSETSGTEKRTVLVLKSTSSLQEEAAGGCSFAESALQRRRLGIYITEAGFMNSSLTLSNANVVERLMSLIG